MSLRSTTAAAKKTSKKAATKSQLTLTPQQILGFQIRDLRRAKRLTLIELAQRINRSVGWLSQIERGMAEISISAMHEIARELDVQISWFFRTESAPDADEIGFVVRKSNRRVMDFHGSGVHEEILSPSISGELLLVETTFEPGARTGDRDRERRGEEAGVVLSGVLELEVEGKTLLLEAGDSFSFTRKGPHRCHNPGKVPTVVLWVHTPASY
jgi:transcriptional regulator with XRE-family HTH domain